MRNHVTFVALATFISLSACSDDSADSGAPVGSMCSTSVVELLDLPDAESDTLTRRLRLHHPAARVPRVGAGCRSYLSWEGTLAATGGMICD